MPSSRDRRPGGGERRPVVDAGLCLGYGFCEDLVPRAFTVDATSLARVHDDFRAVDADDVAAVEVAIRECPVQAISWSTPADMADPADPAGLVERIERTGE